MLTGFGAAIKNIGMGCASRAGKLEQHSDVHPYVNPKICINCGVCLENCPTGAMVQKEETVSIDDDKCIGCGECLVICNVGAVKHRWDSDDTRVQEKMAEYAYSVWSRFNGKIGFINFLLKITKDCDCVSEKGKVIAEDVGLLASIDPVALDKASVDLILQASGKDVIREYNDVDWSVQLRHGEKIGMGSQKYKLIPIE
jgi:uncharacterized Fe-S center protein